MSTTTTTARRDAEAELNLPPGFRFHPTDEELVAHYLCARAAGRRPPVPIIAELDLYRFDPWDLPKRALFGRREWYFFTPRDRKYPNGSRPNRAAGTGYWKATGADKPVAHGGRTVGIKKALVFYHGKPPRGVKTEWIMHEYRRRRRRAEEARQRVAQDWNADAFFLFILQLDDWVLCRLYHKKNEWEKMQQKQQEEEKETESPSFGDTRTPESEIDDADQLPAFGDLGPVMPKEEVHEMEDFSGLGGGDDWLTGINLDDLQGLCPFPGGDDFYSTMLMTPTAAKPELGGFFF
ncbi:hypothetical protein PR202_gb12764 [Eleusine coracana subsp. coracana]|uniref:NAC domain-containing protein n=1 Tax=Eleusine coracana subsp. coracana TaxID=191504 RepID=A0AAV5ENT9_ELECO|nr:hypothetical protein PR202_gb12764 [Eleusine coracana subsp. coracana]